MTNFITHLLKDHKLKTAALVGELCYQIVHSLTDPKEKELLYEIRTNKKGAFHLNPWTSSSTGKLIKLSNSDVIPTINRETESNESQLFKTYFGQYGNQFFVFFSLFNVTEFLSIVDIIIMYLQYFSMSIFLIQS